MNKIKATVIKLVRNRFGFGALLLLILSAMFYALRLRVDTLLGGLFDRWVWDPIARLWNDAAARPLGASGVAVLTIVVALIALAVIDEARTVHALRDWWSRRAVKPPVVGWEEREQVQHFRAMWLRNGKVAGNNLANWFERTRRSIDDKKYYARYLDLPVTPFNDARKEMDSLTEKDAATRLVDVQAATGRFFAEYIRTLGLIATIYEAEFGNADVQFHRAFRSMWASWNAGNKDLMHDLDELWHRPENEGVLAVLLGGEVRRDVRDLIEGKGLPMRGPTDMGFTEQEMDGLKS